MAVTARRDGFCSSCLAHVVEREAMGIVAKMSAARLKGRPEDKM